MVWLMCIISDEEFIIEAELAILNKGWINYKIQRKTVGFDLLLSLFSFIWLEYNVILVVDLWYIALEFLTSDSEFLKIWPLKKRNFLHYTRWLKLFMYSSITDRFEFESWLSHLQALWFWTSYFGAHLSVKRT